jgi:hypothetical protein
VGALERDTSQCWWDGECEVEERGGNREMFLEGQMTCGDRWKEMFLGQEVWREVVEKE